MKKAGKTSWVWVCRILERDNFFGLGNDFYAETEEKILRHLKKNGFKYIKDTDIWINKKKGFIASIFCLTHIKNSNKLLS